MVDMIEKTTYEADSKATAVLDTPESAAPVYWPEQANQALEKGSFQRAVDVCVENLSGGESDPLSGYLIKGKALLALGKLEEAAEEFHLALGREPTSPMALKYLGDIRFAYGAEAVAFSYYERALKSQSMSGGLFSLLSGAPERALRERLDGAVISSPPAAPVSPSDLDLPEIEIVSDEIVDPVASSKKTAAGETISGPATTESESPTKSSLTLRRSPEKPTLPRSAATTEVRISKDIPRFDRLAMAPEYHTETMADLLMRQGHARSAQSVLKTLVARQATPELIEKLKQAESIARKKGQ